MKDVIEIPLTDVIYDKDLYPRAKFDSAIVEQYRDALDVLPPIEITHEKLLIDGYHRLMAHRLEQCETIRATVERLEKEQVLWESVRRNATHGYQLNQKDKKKLGQTFYRQGKFISDIASLLSVTEKSVERWTSDIRQKEKEERDATIWDFWMQCKTQEEIAELMNIAQKTVSNIIDSKKGKLSEITKIPPDSLQYDTIWEFHNNDDRYGMKYPGRIPGQIIENVLWAYTQPFDIVIDPFAGGGTTLDVCKAMSRRYQCFDIKPVRDDIGQQDITQGFADSARKANLIFLDPPYWKQKRGDYSKDETNVANLDVDEYHAAMNKIFALCLEQLAPQGVLAVIVSPTQETVAGSTTIHDHAFHFMAYLEQNAQYRTRIIVPYTTEQLQGFQVSDAKEKRYFLKRHRDLLIYQKMSHTE